MDSTSRERAQGPDPKAVAMPRLGLWPTATLGPSARSQTPAIKKNTKKYDMNPKTRVNIAKYVDIFFIWISDAGVYGLGTQALFLDLR